MGAFCIAYDVYPSDLALMRRRQDFGRIFAGSSIPALWQEYEDAQTPEAKLVKDFDKASLADYIHCLSKVASLSPIGVLASMKEFNEDLLMLCR